ncbi:hypothetical protein K456DRAFT_290374 [Colletotrichum gloeosporioides 23]|nr:hypothetical protein K456DRAFT_290374 [Colletotrichum gloeosporioides 23]
MVSYERSKLCTAHPRRLPVWLWPRWQPTHSLLHQPMMLHEQGEGGKVRRLGKVPSCLGRQFGKRQAPRDLDCCFPWQRVHRRPISSSFSHFSVVVFAVELFFPHHLFIPNPQLASRLTLPRPHAFSSPIPIFGIRHRNCKAPPTRTT